MKSRRILTAVWVIAVLSLPSVWAFSDDFRWDGRLEPGKTLTVRGVNGDVEASPSESGRVEVQAFKRGRRSDPESVTIEIIEHAEGLTVCALYPTPPGEEPNECLPFGRGRSSVRRNDVVVDFVVKVPAQVDFIGRTVNGDIEVEGLDGDVESTTVNGGVEVSTSGIAEATTVNGSIRARIGYVDWEGQLKFTTVNGGITLEFPQDLSTRFRAETLNGSFRSDFDLSQETSSRRRWGPKRKVSGVIGSDSGRELRLKTVNGNIEIRRGAGD